MNNSYKKVCIDCNQLKSRGDFNKRSKNKDGLNSRCAVCSAKKYKKWQEDNPELALKRKEYLRLTFKTRDKKEPSVIPKDQQSKFRDIKRKYGLSYRDYQKMYIDQNGLCAGCKTIPKKICVDHDHTTKKVRGLLCDRCNLGLGMLNDKITTLKNLVCYLEKS